MRRKSLPDGVVIEMENARCRIAAIEVEDPRCCGLLRGVEVEMEDPRCKGLLHGVAIEVDDLRCKMVAIEVDDPRCRSLHVW